MSWEIVYDFTIYVCTECGNDIPIIQGMNPPEKCPYCIGEKVSRKDIIKKLAEKLYNKNMCPCNCGRIRQSCAFRMETVINCWIAWAEEKIKNGT